MKTTRFTFLVGALSLLLISAGPGSKKVKQADSQFKQENYHEAKELYLKSYSKVKSLKEKSRVIYNIAECFRILAEPEQAETWYNKSIVTKNNPPVAHWHLGNALKAQGKLDDACKQYEAYKKEVPTDPLADVAIESCKVLPKWLKEPSKYEVAKEYVVNSRQYDFSPIFADRKNEAIIISSSRPTITSDNDCKINGEPYQDLYLINRTKGNWGAPILLNDNINTEFHEGSACLNRKKNTLYFTRCPNAKKQNLGCDIFVSKKVGNDWGRSEKIVLKPEDGDSISIGHPAISPNDKHLVFASDMDGGYGGHDLWMISYNKSSSTWSDPVNLGEDVNTPGDELFPYIHETGVLYFSSNGHPGFGGLDIFRAFPDENKKWIGAENMMMPINSYGHDHGIVFERGKNRGFFASDRKGTSGKDDIYGFYEKAIKVDLVVNVYNRTDKTPVSGVNIKVTGSNGEIYTAKTGEDGSFLFSVNGDKPYITPENLYAINVNKTKYLNSTSDLDTKGVIKSTLFVKDFFIDPVGTPPIPIPKVLYVFGEPTLVVNEKVNSKDSLDYLYKTLIDNPTIIIELQSHTDSRGTKRFNDILSQKRAETCVNYLIEKGIPKDRMVAKGYGESRTLFTDKAIAKMPTEEEREAAHQASRRTEFSILSWDYKTDH
jgi:peptidoglycan-associated lipoprotein